MADPLDKFDRRARSGHSSSSSAPTKPKPLVDYVTNSWQHDSRYDYDAPVDRYNQRFLDALSKIPDLLRSRRVRRYVAIWVVLFMLTLSLWKSFFGPVFYEERRLSMSLSSGNKLKAGGVFGTNDKHMFSDMIQVKSLDRSLLPDSKRRKDASPSDGRRLIFVGDVHGCKDELVHLLEVVKYDQKTDHLVLLGDMVTKGPDSLAVIDLARQLGASCVRGNHEDRVLLVRKDIHSSLLPLQGPDEPESMTVLDDLDEESYSRGDYSDRILARQLSLEQYKYLASCPVILKIGVIGDLGEVVAVHAGLVPGVSFEHQDPFTVMSMRSIDLDTHVPSKSPATGASGKEGKESEKDRNKRMSLVPWTKLWNKYQKLLPNPNSIFSHGHSGTEQHATVIYGHDSRRGLQLAKWTKGIDTGCVRGGRLTALIISDGGMIQTENVACKDYRPRRPLRVEVEDVLNEGKSVQDE